ncbi:DMT family transporter [Halorarius litoreus]|uniref:DMT family transporter n=1 Tax=Halorarius litoreus TaxID=2962676 RepID=UPI0020CB6FD7|nr:EamA family transporter [Halorarius litoreus]
MSTSVRYPVLAPLIASAIWGGMYVVSKWVFASMPPLALAFCRVVLGSIVLLAVVRATKPERAFSRRDWLGFAGLAVVLAVSLATQFLGTDLTSAGQGSLVTVLSPVFTLALGVAVLDESLGPRKLAGAALALVGTGLVLAGRYDPTALAVDTLLGPGMLVLAAATWAAYTAFGKPLIRKYSALEAATYTTVLSIPLFGLFALAEFWWVDASAASVTVTPGLVAAVLYLGVVSTALAWYLWYKGMEQVDAGTVAVTFFAQPVVGVGLGALLLDEPIGPLFLVGGVVMAAGVYLVSTARVDSPESSGPAGAD